MRNIATNLLIFNRLKFIWNLFVFYRNLQETKIIVKKGKYSLSLAHILNISLFFMCFNSCGKASAQEMSQVNASQTTTSHVNTATNQACMSMDWSSAWQHVESKK
jgi:hypothetical protein